MVGSVEQNIELIVICKAVFVGNFLIAQSTQQEVFEHRNHFDFKIMMVKGTFKK